MVRVLVVNNLNRNTVIVEPTESVGKVLQDNGVDYNRYQVQMNGTTLTDFDKNFSDYGVEDFCTLAAIVKLDNA